MAGTLSRLERRSRASLRMSLATGQKVEEPKVANILGDLQKPRCDRLKIGLHRIDHARPFVHQSAAAARQALEDVVLLRRCHDFLQHLAGHGQVIAELEQLQGLAAIDAVALGRGRKDLLEAGELQIVDIEQLPAPGPDQTVERPDVAVVAFHGHGNRHRMTPTAGLDPGEEFPEPFRRMRDLKFLQQAAVRQPDGNTVAPRADINADTKFAKIRGSAWIAPSANKIVGSSSGLVYLQSHNR